MKCPYGREVNDPPNMSLCPLGFPGCSCMDEMMIEASELADGADATRNQMVKAFWWRDDEEPDEP